MNFFLLIVPIGVVVCMARAAAHAVSAANLDHALRAEAPTREDVASVMP
jgi:hypothetical protein